MQCISDSYLGVKHIYWVRLVGILLNNKHFEGYFELLSKQCDIMSISVISILQKAKCPLYISLTCNVGSLYISLTFNVHPPVYSFHLKDE